MIWKGHDQGRTLQYQVGTIQLSAFSFEIEWREGQPASAKNTLAKIEAIAAEVDVKPGSELAAQLDKIRETLGSRS